MSTGSITPTKAPPPMSVEERLPWIDRAAWAIFAVSAIASAVLILYLNRNTTFFFDELVWFGDLSTYTDPSAVLVPHNSHLHGTTRIVYFAVIDLLGLGHTVLRVLGVATVLLCAALFFAYARRRVGTVGALVPAILLLFYGSAWQHVVGSIGFTVLGSIAAGLAALLMLDRGGRRADVLACAFLCLSVFTFTVGLGFLVGAAISVLLRRDRISRAWIFSVPLVLYSAWWLWAQQFGQGRTELANLDGVVEFFGVSLAVVTGALTGVNVPFSRFDDVPGVRTAPASALGWVIAVLFVAAVVWRISRGNVPRSLWCSLGVVGTYWLAAALAQPIFFETQADASRYVYPGSVGVLLVAVDAAKGLRPGRRAVAVLLAVGAFSLAMNVIFLRDGAAYLSDYSAEAKSSLAMLELAAGMEPGSAEGDGPPNTDGLVGGISWYASGPDRDQYLEASQLYGSPAYTLDQVRESTPEARLAADGGLLSVYGVGLQPSPEPPSGARCEVLDAGSPAVEVPPEGLYLRSRGAEPLPLHVVRFSDGPGAPLPAPLPTESWSVLDPPEDGAPEPWRVAAALGAVTVCSVG